MNPVSLPMLHLPDRAGNRNLNHRNMGCGYLTSASVASASSNWGEFFNSRYAKNALVFVGEDLNESRQDGLPVCEYPGCPRAAREFEMAGHIAAHQCDVLSTGNWFQ